eukprot:CAMPEP_0202830674 /NCGR_PEP_ID=MMETSP1389-20130828/16327_1 /ASSEMBLY_ACC=CAM_ASM_000865 /TAXON_ID=302021 /ORGANISM="Rhodomonas sp., Strain CCMP768" /LENGTH=218 /DNA_ID=CAMNT_0049504335 /DNA_START=39 /DNA_END=696 /DNA_ORIENTATION=-
MRAVLAAAVVAVVAGSFIPHALAEVGCIPVFNMCIRPPKSLWVELKDFVLKLGYAVSVPRFAWNLGSGLTAPVAELEKSAAVLGSGLEAPAKAVGSGLEASAKALGSGLEASAKSLGFWLFLSTAAVCCTVCFVFRSWQLGTQMVRQMDAVSPTKEAKQQSDSRVTHESDESSGDLLALKRRATSSRLSPSHRAARSRCRSAPKRSAHATAVKLFFFV